MTLKSVQLVEPAGLAVICYEEGLSQLGEDRYFTEIVDLKTGALRETPELFKGRKWVALKGDGKSTVVLRSEVMANGQMGTAWITSSPPATESQFGQSDVPLNAVFNQSATKGLLMFRNGRSQLISPATPYLWHVLETGEDTLSVRGVFSADSKAVALQVLSTANDELSFKEYRVYSSDGKLVASTPSNSKENGAFALTADGSRLLFMKGTQVQALEVATNQVTPLTNLGEPVNSMAISPAGPFMLVGLTDRVKLLSTVTGETLAEIPLPRENESVRNVGFSQDGTRFYATQSSTFTWNDLNRAGARPRSMDEALGALAVPSILTFHATRYLACEQQNLRGYLEQMLEERPLPATTLPLLEKSVAAWDANKFVTRQAASTAARKELEKLNWVQLHAAEKALQQMVARQMARSDAPLEIQARSQALLGTGTIPAMLSFRDSEGYRAKIDSLLGKPLGKKLRK